MTNTYCPQCGYPLKVKLLKVQCPGCGEQVAPTGPSAHIYRIERFLWTCSFVCILIVIMITALYGFLPSYIKQHDAKAIMAARPVMNAVATSISERTRAIEDDAILLAESLRHQLELDYTNQMENKALMNRFLQSYPEVKLIYTGLTDKRMVITPDTELPSDYDPTSTRWYQNALAVQKLLWTEPYYESDTSQIVTTMTKPLYSELAADDSKDKCLGVLGFDLLYSEILQQAFNAHHRPSTIYQLTIVNNHGDIVYGDNAQWVGQRAPYEALVRAVMYDISGLLQFQTAREQITLDILRIDGTNLYIVASLK